MDQNKPIRNVNRNKTPDSRLRQKDWVNRARGARPELLAELMAVVQRFAREATARSSGWTGHHCRRATPQQGGQ